MTVVLVVAAVLGWSLAVALLIGRGIAIADRADLADYRRLADHTDRLTSGAETGHGTSVWLDGRWIPLTADLLAQAFADDPDGLEAFAWGEIMAGRLSIDTLRRARALAEADS